MTTHREVIDAYNRHEKALGRNKMLECIDLTAAELGRTAQYVRSVLTVAWACGGGRDE